MGTQKQKMTHDSLNYSLSIRNNQLYIEECNVTELARQFGTPLFVVSENHLRYNLRQYQNIFKQYWPEGDVKIMPSIKASPVIAVRKILSQEGAGCDVFGSGELEAAIRGDTPPELISVNGSIKDNDIIRRSIELGSTIVLDSPRELEICQQHADALKKNARIMLRIKPYMSELEVSSDYVPDQKIRDLTQTIKYGIPSSELFTMLKRIPELTNIDLVGIHAHMGRQSKKGEVWQAWVKSFVELTKEVSLALGGWQPQELNLGGGFPSLPDQDTDVSIKGYRGPSLEELASIITTELRKELTRTKLKSEGLTLSLEPGRGIHCDTGIHLSSVKNIKEERHTINHKWAEVDTSQMFLGIGGANFNNNKFELVVANKASAEKTCKIDIVGKTCNLEILFYQEPAPKLEVDDIIALLNTGSYIEPCAQNFNALPRPGMILVHDGEAVWIKRHETVEDVFSRDITPNHLQP